MTSTGKQLPIPDATAGLQALRAMAAGTLRHPALDLLGALQAFHRQVGDMFQVQVPGLQMVVMAGPDAARTLFLTQRERFLWRPQGDAVTQLLRHGVLVEDGADHDRLRALMDPPLVGHNLQHYLPAMLRYCRQVTSTWQPGSQQDMLVEMRRIALLILVDTLFGVDLTPDLKRIWRPILRAISYISPGPWLLWPAMPRPGYRRHLDELDRWLYQIISQRRARQSDAGQQDLLGRLIQEPDLDDGLIRDQLLTMLIAGHDTSTALLAWTLYLLGSHPQVMQQVQHEVDQHLGQAEPTIERVRSLTLLDQVLKETLRLYPPIHAAMRRVPEGVTVNGFQIPAGSRVLFSIYLTHRHPAHWESAESFLPERFAPDRGHRQAAFTYLPFGAGPRNCIGATYGKLEAQVVIAWLLQHFTLTLTQGPVHPHMGATLEPRPGVTMQVEHRPVHAKVHPS